MDEELPAHEDPKAQGKNKALYLLGIQRAKSWSGRRIAREELTDIVRVRYRDLEAIVKPAVFEMAELDTAAVQEHQRAVEAAMRRGTILPSPFGVIFNGRRPLIRLLQEQYLVLDEALSFVEGQCEVRLHIMSTDGGEPDEETLNVANQIYSDLRRSARAAIPFPREGSRLLSSAFLVERTGWVEFIQRAENLASPHADVNLDITGPWPPYDFVRFVV